MEKKFEETAYVICHNGSDVIHPVQVEPGTVLTTGQPNVEEFTDKEAWEARLVELGYDVAQLHPPSLEASEHLAALEAGGAFGARAGRPGRAGKEGRKGGLLTAEERKSLSPEERKALRAERMGARKAERAARKAALAGGAPAS